MIVLKNLNNKVIYKFIKQVLICYFFLFLNCKINNIPRKPNKVENKKNKVSKQKNNNKSNKITKLKKAGKGPGGFLNFIEKADRFITKIGGTRKEIKENRESIQSLFSKRKRNIEKEKKHKLARQKRLKDEEHPYETAAKLHHHRLKKKFRKNDDDDENEEEYTDDEEYTDEETKKNKFEEEGCEANIT